MTNRGDRIKAGKTRSANARARREAEKQASELARSRLAPFKIDQVSVHAERVFGDDATTSRMQWLFSTYEDFLMAKSADDPLRYFQGDRNGAGGFLAEQEVQECRRILERFRPTLSQERLRAFEGVLALWEDGYDDPEFRRRLRGEAP